MKDELWRMNYEWLIMKDELWMVNYEGWKLLDFYVFEVYIKHSALNQQNSILNA